MSETSYLIVHKETRFDPWGVNSGAEMATLFLCRYLAKTGRRVILAANFAGEERKESGVEYWNLGPIFDVADILRRARNLGSYHLISAGRAGPLLMSQSEESCISRSLISHDRASGDTGIDAKVLSQVVDNIFCVSEAQKAFFVADGADPSKISVINNGVNLDLFPPAPFAGRNKRNLIFAGALVPDKGLHLLIESYAKLKQKYEDLSLDVYGSADLWCRAEYLNQEEIKAALPGIKFHGKVAQETLSAALQKAAICVVPSIWFDPFPLVSIDAQATGCPVVAFDVGGIKEGIIDGETGAVIKEVSEKALTETLDRLLEDPKLLERLSDNAIKSSRPRFTWEKLVASLTARCERKRPADETPKIALFSTWNQQCGLATYASYLFSELPSERYIVLAEDAVEKVEPSDAENVFRCWSGSDTDFEKIIRILKENQVELLFFNFHTHYRRFAQPELNNFIAVVQALGIKVVVHLHNTFTVDEKLAAFIGKVDQVIVFSPENRLEAIASGARPENTWVLPHGVRRIRSKDKQKLRADLGISPDTKVISSFGFVQAHKGIEGLIEAVAALKQKNIPVRGYILGGAAKGDPQSENYREFLRQAAQQLGVRDDIIFSEGFVEESKVNDFLAISDLVFMNYRSQHYEASGACSIAVGAGALVAASIAPAFAPFEDAVWHMSAGFSAALSAELLLMNNELASEVRKNAQAYSEKYSWANVARTLKVKLRDLVGSSVREKRVERKAMSAGRSQGLRVLMQNRGTTFTHRGGDTIVMERTIEGLEKKGVQVTVDLACKEDPKNFDLVHLFNFVLSDLVKYCAERAVNAGVPYVVTTLYEDIARFHNPSVLQANLLVEYVKNGQNRGWYEGNRIDFAKVEACSNFDNSWAARHAAALIANGHEEAASLRKDYPFARDIQIVPVGYDIKAEGDADLFFKEYGLRDFVFCVGRLESRKNQLMLLKALEDLDLPVVFAGGGFTYQPEYDQAVRNFKRKGQTVVLGKLSPQMLASAYAAAKVHVLPSWYELPGLVSLEAAYYGCNVVVTDYGNARSYLGDKAFYCEPGSESSILHAVLASYYSPQKDGLKELSMKYTWEKAAELTLESYKSVLSGSEPAAKTEESSIQVYDLENDGAQFQELLEKGEIAAKDKDLIAAEKYLAEAESINPNSVRLLRARGAVSLARGEVEVARRYFTRGIELDSENARLYSGLGMCEMQSKAPEKAYALFNRALEIAPHQLVAILQLLECSYILDKFDDLERVLRQYLADNPSDGQMRYCLAGCLFKLKKLDEAEQIVEELLSINPTNLGASQLKTAIAEARNTAAVNDTAASRGSSHMASPVPEVEAAPLANEVKINIPKINRPTPAFDSVDVQIAEIEEKKRIKEYVEVSNRAAEILTRPGLREDQREKLTLLQAEAEVLLGEIVSADSRYNQVLAKNPDSPRALCGKGAIAANRGNWEEASDYFHKANRLNPEYDVAWAGLGLYHYSKQNHEKAWQCFMRAIELNPENVRALLGIIELGYSLRRLTDVENVIKIYLEMHPLDLNFVYSLAGCYFAQDKLQEAISELDKIRMFDADNQNAAELRELIDEKLGYKTANAGA